MPHTRRILSLGNVLISASLLFGLISAGQAPAAQAAPAPAFVAPLGATYTVSDVIRKFKLSSSVGHWPTCASSSNRRDAACYALKQIGDPYRYGAEGPGSFDCSGLIYAAYRSTGVTVPRTSGGLASRSYRVSRSSAWMGDIAYKYGHVGLILGRTADGRLWMIHAPHSGSYVKVVVVPSTMHARRLRL